VEDLSEIPQQRDRKPKKEPIRDEEPNNKLKNILEGINRLKEVEEWISDVGDRVMERNQAEQEKEKRLTKNETRLRELSDTIQYNNTALQGS